MRQTLLFIFYMIIVQTVIAQELPEKPIEPYRSLIFTEFRNHLNLDAYVELTNVGDKSINLGDYYLFNMWAANNAVSNVIRDELGEITNLYFSPTYDPTFHTRLPEKVLAPGESFVIIPVSDRILPDGNLVQRKSLVEKADMFVHVAESVTDTSIQNSYYPEYQNYNFDSISVHHQLVRGGIGSNSLVLVHRYYDLEGNVADSAAVDLVNFGINESGAHLSIISNVAGVSQAPSTHILVRKASVTKGNLNWSISAGVSTEDSEWMCIPHYWGSEVYTTIGEHGDFEINISSESLVFDFENSKIITPWGIDKGDSIIINNMELGPGMAWVYRINQDNFEGLGLVTCQTGDTLTLYAAGNELTTIHFKLEIDASADNVTRIFPRRQLFYPDGIPTWGGVPYYVTKHINTMDTIGNVPYNLVLTTLLENLEKSPGASWEIIYVDGDNRRISAKNGDILRVTAANGVNTENYFINVLPYAGSANSFLSAIIWPDKPGYLDGWKQDTIPGFLATVRSYIVSLPYGTRNVPALQGIPTNLNAGIQIEPAKNLTSSLESDRTTTIIVTSEDSSSISQYKVVFRISRPEFLEQKWEAEPFISELVLSQHSNNSFAEICNPGDNLLDMSNYMFIISNSTNNPAQAIANVIPTLEGNYNNRYDYNAAYIPGMKWPATMEEWDQNGKVMIYDPIVNPLIEPGNVFVIGNASTTPRTSAQASRANVLLGQHLNTWGETNLNTRAMLHIRRGARGIFLFKILEDSIITGQKQIKDITDFELIDFFGPATLGADWVVAGSSIAVSSKRSLQRKPHWVTPSPLPESGWGTNIEDSDWHHIFENSTFNDVLYNDVNLGTNLGAHDFIPYKDYISTVSSSLYIVSEGYQGLLNIRGVDGGENVEQFFANIIKANENQTLEVLSGETLKELSEIVANGDVLKVTSADGENQTEYQISTASLNDNTLLTAASGSGLIIERDGVTGTISGFTFGTSVSSILSNVLKPDNSELIVENPGGELITLNLFNTDTVKVARTASETVYFRVIAENRTSYTSYKLAPSTSESDAYVLSDVYKIIQPDSMAITMIQPNTSVKTLLANLLPAGGANLMIYDAAGKLRDKGIVGQSDLLYVRSKDGTALSIYYLMFIDESEEVVNKKRQIPGPVSALSLEIISPDGTEATLVWDYVTEFEHGFIILRDGEEVGVTFGNSFTDSGLTLGASYQYTVYAYNELGNSDESSINIVANPTGKDQRTPGADITIFPTITKDKVYMNNLPENCNVVVMDIFGRILKEMKVTDNSSSISFISIPNGVYLVVVSKNNEIILSTRVAKK